jgi:hypothetical protein
MKIAAIVFAATAPLLLGQVSGSANRFSGPTLGFVPGSTANQLLLIRGIPGAARLSDSVSLENTITRTYLAPGHSYALAAQGAADPVAVIVLRGAEGIEANPVLAPMAGAMPRPDLVAFSPTGLSAALYSEERNSIQVFTGLPTSPHVAGQFSTLPFAARALAVSDDAQILLSADAAGTVYGLSSNSAAVPVYHASQVSALAFVWQSHDAVVCDPVLGSAVILQSGRLPVATFQAPSNDGCQPRATASTMDGKIILMACPAQRLIWSVDRALGSTNVYKINSSPIALDRLGRGDTFLTSPADDGGTYWLLTWHSGGPVMSFIGAAQSSAQGSHN